MIRKYYEYSGLGGGAGEAKKLLTKEQLLIPRYMCTGTEKGDEIWPGSSMASDKFVTGGILTLDTKTSIGQCFKDWTGREWYMAKLNQFPHLFRPMPWWEGRKPEDMPEYIKYGQGAVYKVIEWKENEHYGVYALCERGEDYPLIMQPQTSPATEQEYWDSKPLRKCPDCGSEWKGNDSCPECFPI